MHSRYRPALLRSGLLVLLSIGQQGLINDDFEADAIGDVPRGWYIPKPCSDAGYGLEVSEVGANGGKRCAVLSGTGGDSRIFGNCMQSVDATPFRGKRLRFSAAVRCEPADEESRAQLWFRVDRPDRQMGFFDNMGDRPIRAEEWQRYEIVGDVADDAESIALGMILIGGGTAMLDDVLLEVTDGNVPTTGAARPSGAPGLAVADYAAKADVMRDTDSAKFRFPLPLAYGDQTPLTFRLQIDPPDIDARIEISAGQGPNRVLELELREVARGAGVTLRYESVVLIGPTSFSGVPAEAAFPAEWPAEATPWLAASWCCDSKDERIMAIGDEIKTSGGNVMAVVDGVLKRSQLIFQEATGRVMNLTAVEALDKQGSCTSCANLVAALLRSTGVPARILAGYPLWSGPLQTHYIVEAFVPGYGWYPVESTLGQAPWPNHQQINVSIVPIEHESEELARLRSRIAGAVPFLSLTEYEPDSPIMFEGVLKPQCDHEGRLLRPFEAPADEWQAAQTWARARWSKWLESEPEIKAGSLAFGPASDALEAKTLEELRAELR